MFKFEVQTSAGAIHQHFIIDDFSEITLDKHRKYFKEILPHQPKLNEDNEWDADFVDVYEWAVSVCALFSNCAEDTIWGLPPYFVLGGRDEAGEYFHGLVYKVIEAFAELQEYENNLNAALPTQTPIFDVIKGEFTHKGIMYYLPAKGFDATKMAEFVKLQQLQVFADKLIKDKSKMELKAQRVGRKIESDEWDTIASMLAILAKPKIGGSFTVGYNKKEVAQREEAFKDIPVYLLKDIGFFLQKIARTMERNSQLYSKARELVKLKEELSARQASTSGTKQSKTSQSSKSSPAQTPSIPTKLRSFWTRIQTLFSKPLK